MSKTIKLFYRTETRKSSSFAFIVLFGKKKNCFISENPDEHFLHIKATSTEYNCISVMNPYDFMSKHTIIDEKCPKALLKCPKPC